MTLKHFWWVAVLLALGLQSQPASANPSIAIGWNERHLKVSLNAGGISWRDENVRTMALPPNKVVEAQLMAQRPSVGEISSQSAALWLQRSFMAHWPTRVLPGVKGYSLMVLDTRPLPGIPWDAPPAYVPWLPGYQQQVLILNIFEQQPLVLRDKSLALIPTDRPAMVGQTSFRGQVVFNPNRNEMLTSINILPLEEYLLGVVPNEMPALWPSEALKAQALAARTYAVRQMGRHQADGFDLCSTIHCQAYGALTSEHARTSEAVRETRGEIILYGETVIDSVYHAHAGGQTRNSEFVWGGVTPYLKGVRIPEEPIMVWTRRVPWSEFQERLWARGFKAHFYYGVAELLLVDAGHVGSVRLDSALGEVLVRAGEMRAALDRTLMRSTRFTIREQNGYLLPFRSTRASFVFPSEAGSFAGLYTSLLPQQPSFVEFEGQGHGHGVGMSQWGAFGLARAGHGYQNIIKRFYTGVRIARMW